MLLWLLHALLCCIGFIDDLFIELVEYIHVLKDFRYLSSLLFTKFVTDWFWYVSWRELFSPAQKYQLLVYHADAIFHDKEYRNAACKYSMALQQKKVLNKTSKVRTSAGGAGSNLQAQVCTLVQFLSFKIFVHLWILFFGHLSNLCHYNE